MSDLARTGVGMLFAPFLTSDARVPRVDRPFVRALRPDDVLRRAEGISPAEDPVEDYLTAGDLAYDLARVYRWHETERIVTALADRLREQIDHGDFSPPNGEALRRRLQEVYWRFRLDAVIAKSWTQDWTDESTARSVAFDLNDIVVEIEEAHAVDQDHGRDIWIRTQLASAYLAASVGAPQSAKSYFERALNASGHDVGAFHEELVADPTLGYVYMRALFDTKTVHDAQEAAASEAWISDSLLESTRTLDLLGKRRRILEGQARETFGHKEFEKLIGGDSDARRENLRNRRAARKRSPQQQEYLEALVDLDCAHDMWYNAAFLTGAWREQIQIDKRLRFSRRQYLSEIQGLATTHPEEFDQKAEALIRQLPEGPAFLPLRASSYRLWADTLAQLAQTTADPTRAAEYGRRALSTYNEAGEQFLRLGQAGGSIGEVDLLKQAVMCFDAGGNQERAGKAFNQAAKTIGDLEYAKDFGDRNGEKFALEQLRVDLNRAHGREVYRISWGSMER